MRLFSRKQFGIFLCQRVNCFRENNLLSTSGAFGMYSIYRSIEKAEKPDAFAPAKMEDASFYPVGIS